MRLLLFNLKMDADDPVLGFAMRWVEAIAERVERVAVVTMAAGRVAVPRNVEVFSVGKERGLSEPRRALEFQRLTHRIVWTLEPDACFSHMIPVFSVLFAPTARVHRIPTLLWYAHGAVPWELRVAERLVDRCVTSAPQGFRLPSRKLHVLQQGIDTRALVIPPSPPPGWADTVVTVGRIGPVKRLVESARVVAEVRRTGAPVRWAVFGAPATPADHAYLGEVQAAVERLDIADAVEFHGPIPHARIGEAFAHGAWSLNLSSSGSLDKAILEAMSCGSVPVSDNAAFADLAARNGWQGLVAGPGEAAGVLLALRAMDGDAQQQLRRAMRAYVESEHGLERLADRIVEHLEDLTAPGRGRA